MRNLVILGIRKLKRLSSADSHGLTVDVRKHCTSYEFYHKVNKSGPRRVSIEETPDITEIPIDIVGPPWERVGQSTF